MSLHGGPEHDASRRDSGPPTGGPERHLGVSSLWFLSLDKQRKEPAPSSSAYSEARCFTGAESLLGGEFNDPRVATRRWQLTV